MAEVVQKYFCHQCSVEVPTVGPDFTCPTCRSGFVGIGIVGFRPGREYARYRIYL